MSKSLLDLLERVGGVTRAAYDADRRKNPARFLDARDGLAPKYLFVENVARMLGCNVDHIRRIPRDELPASKVGNRLLYSRSDVEAYILALRGTGGRAIAVNSKLQRVAISSRGSGSTFDPVEYLSELLEGNNDGSAN